MKVNALNGKTIRAAWRNDSGHLILSLTDGTRLEVDDGMDGAVTPYLMTSDGWVILEDCDEEDSL